jgi:hypothetical protein
LAEVLAAVVTGLSAVLVALVSALGHRLAKIHREVSNDHATNLRDDVDKIKDGIERLADCQRSTTARLESLSLDLGTERAERAALAGRVSNIETDLYH